MARIFLNKKRSKNGVDKENHLNIQLNGEYKILPPTDIETNVNAYEQYLSEKKNSQTYRLSFNVTPLCSNVLFNKISEIVYHEGGDDCIVFNKENTSGKINNNELIKEYCNYKNVNINSLTRSNLIRDTGFSHPECGGVTYHCGYDIFNNHTLRNKNFVSINTLNNINEKKKNFNTLYDLKRDKNGNNIVINTLDKNGNESKNEEHLYLKDDVYTFEETINENLVEKNGWIGFINPTTLNIPNYGSISLNKCMNNNKACEMYDMYPDRSLFSFIPKINKYRENRVENNWDYCLTYPFKNFYDNELVTYKSNNGTKINGLKAVITDNIFTDDFIDEDDIGILTLKTIIKHNFVVGDKINVVLIGNDSKGEEKIVTLDNDEIITKVGFEGKNKEYYFSIYGEELIGDLNSFAIPSQVEIRVQKMSAYGPCEYYFRKFRRIPNLNHINILNDNINEEDIKKYSNIDFNSTLNNLGFSRTIYNDKNAQLLFNDDVKLNGLVDNLGREISEIYLTIVKNNEGHKEWYNLKDYTSDAITNSRCFGKITSGVEMLDSYNIDYNIHIINNVSPDIIEKMSGGTGDILVKEFYQNFFNIKEDLDGNKIYKQPKVLEDDINIHGTFEQDARNNEFFGDIVEFNKEKLSEYTLTDVLHRFNTVQREILDEEYRDLIVDEIMYDDYDLYNSFSGETKIYNKLNDDVESGSELYIPFNIDAEGYYYKPHHKITLKRYKEKINQGIHTKIMYDNIRKAYEEDVYYLLTSKEYYLKKSDKLHFFHKKYEEYNIGEVTDIKEDINSNKWLVIKVKLSDELENYSIFKIENINGVYELNDGTGRYLWRDLLDEHEYDFNDEITKYIFTNNAHYINKNILFTLHRQDPNGEYGISGINAPTPIINNFTVGGDTNDYSDIETMLDEIEGGDLSC